MKTLSKHQLRTVKGGTDHCKSTYDKIKEIADKAITDIQDLVNSSLDKVGEGANKIADKINEKIDRK